MLDKRWLLFILLSKKSGDLSPTLLFLLGCLGLLRSTEWNKFEVPAGIGIEDLFTRHSKAPCDRFFFAL